MSKEYGYFEAMEEIIKDESKVFIGGSERNKKLFYNRLSCYVRITDKNDNCTHGVTPSINYFWINTKWTLAEEKKKYNIRVYNVDSGKLISSENVTMTEEEIKIYCNSKVIQEKASINIISTIEIYDTSIPIKRAITKVVSEEITT